VKLTKNRTFTSKNSVNVTFTVFLLGVSITGYPPIFHGTGTGTGGSWNEGTGTGTAYTGSSYLGTGPGTARNRFRYRVPGLNFF
jgi:hypothetical protein